MKAYLRAEDPNQFERVFDMEILPAEGTVIIVRKGDAVERWKVTGVEFEFDNHDGSQTAQIHVEKQIKLNELVAKSTGKIAYPDTGVV
jgi:hypothetical protein